MPPDVAELCHLVAPAVVAVPAHRNAIRVGKVVHFRDRRESREVDQRLAAGVMEGVVETGATRLPTIINAEVRVSQLEQRRAAVPSLDQRRDLLVDALLAHVLEHAVPASPAHGRRQRKPIVVGCDTSDSKSTQQVRAHRKCKEKDTVDNNGRMQSLLVL